MSRFSGRFYPGASRDVRAARRNEAAVRQASFEAEIAKVAHEQNCLEETARDVVLRRRRFERRLIARMLENPLIHEVRL